MVALQGAALFISPNPKVAGSFPTMDFFAQYQVTINYISIFFLTLHIFG